VPCGDKSGLPIGLQIVGRIYEESLVLRRRACLRGNADAIARGA